MIDDVELMVHSRPLCRLLAAVQAFVKSAHINDAVLRRLTDEAQKQVSTFTSAGVSCMPLLNLTPSPINT